jgi:NitT/TauT family transport system ATP-binding protein
VSIVSLAGVDKTFGTGTGAVTALGSVDLHVERGEFVCLIGASGCGKSTILNLVAGLEAPSAGTVDVDGQVAMMFQESALFPWLTVADNIELPMRLAGIGKTQRAARSRELIRTVKLDGFADKRPTSSPAACASEPHSREHSDRMPTSCSWTNPSERSTR